MLIKGLRNILEEYDGEMEIIYLDDEREICELDENEIFIYNRNGNTMLALRELK